MVRSSKKSSGLRNAILILPLIAIVALVWLILLRIDQIPETMTMNLTFDSWVNLWLVILILIFLILVCIPQVGQSSSKEDFVPKKRAKNSRTIDIDEDIKSTETKKSSTEKPVEFVPLPKSSSKRSEFDVDSTTDKKPEPLKGMVSDMDLKEKEKDEMKSADIVARPVSKDKMKPQVFEYPLDVEGGLYGDTFIELGDETVLKLRTLVVKDIYIM
jgi:hypothetical protein